MSEIDRSPWVVAAERPQLRSGVRIGNRFFNATFTRYVAQVAQAEKVAGIYLPELGEVTRQWSWALRIRNRKHEFLDGHILNMEHLHESLCNPNIDALVVRGWGMRLEYLLESRLQWQAKALQLIESCPVTELEKRLVIHIRGGDAINGTHPDYFPLPIELYEEIIEESKLSPMFVGQVNDDENWYIQDLKRRFRGADFVGGTPMEDFRLLAASHTKVLSISSFAWAAAWLGRSDAQIVIPKAGLLSPDMRPDIDLLPINDPNYFVVEFPPVSRRDFASTKDLLRNLTGFKMPTDWRCSRD